MKKSWDTFSNSQRPTPPLTPQAKVNACIQNFSEFHNLCIGWGERELRENLEKEALSYAGTQK